EFVQKPDGSVTLTLTAADLAGYPQTSGVFVIEAKDQKNVLVSLPISALTGTNALQVKTDSGTVVLTKKMLAAFQAAYGDTIEISVKSGSFIVELLAGGEPVAYNNPANPLIIQLPLLFAVADPNGYVAVKRDGGTDSVIPYSIYKDGEIVFQTAVTGTFDTVLNTKEFNDTAEHWAGGFISFVSARSMFSGYGNEVFAPQDSMTRAMFAQVLANIEGVDLTGYIGSRFTDVSENVWYAPAVEWAADSGIVSGFGNGTFGPEDAISREQMAVMLANYIEHKGYGLPSGDAEAFNDESDIAFWALAAVRMMQQAGIVSGMPGHYYAPQGTATRAEVAAIFTMFIEVYLNYFSEQL
ncbi:MAG: S-layer homology domain-containing protein, partial [Defluviitaleaceae bacterium]|nr:S-layer homology domain-containing protein [Defluviitaleaceae bacterium]